MLKTTKCVNCGEDRMEEFYVSNKRKCKSCLKKYQVQVLQPRYREKQARYYRQWYADNGRRRSENYMDVIMLWREKHPKEMRVGEMVRNAVKKGWVGKPLRCIICNRTGRINAHHEDYDKPFEIDWLCSSCHKKIHLGFRLDKQNRV